jgi:hypothetical protein
MTDKQPTKPGKRQKESGDRRPPGLAPGLWWAVMLALLIWNAMLFLSPSKPEAAIPYSTFLKQVRTGNVSKDEPTFVGGLQADNLAGVQAVILAGPAESSRKRIPGRAA